MRGGIWGMLADAPRADNTIRPRVDIFRSTRVDIFPSLLSPNLAVRYLMVPNTIVLALLVRGGRKNALPYEQVTVVEWRRLFVTEQARSGKSQGIAKQVLNYMVLGKQEAWAAATHRVIMYAPRSSFSSPLTMGFGGNVLFVAPNRAQHDTLSEKISSSLLQKSTE